MTMMTSMDRRNSIAQWAFDTRPILLRFHIWIEDVEESWSRGAEGPGFSFVPPGFERGFVMAAAVTALGTRLFGRYGEGTGLGKKEMNRVKKDADAVSAYALSEAFWHLTRWLPENHALMISLGEGLIPKGGETPDMGSNPLLGFGRVYARPEVARFLDRRVSWLINDPKFTWDDFWRHVRAANMTVWGASVDTLENTTRFAAGSPTGPLTVFHLFDQPLRVTRPYEGYVGTLILPREVVDSAARRSVLINYHSSRALVLDAIRATYPNIPPGRIHVWTLGGASRTARIGSLWKEWQDLGVGVVDDGWEVVGTGIPAFTDSGTYAPVFRVGVHEDEAGDEHLFLTDGYAATAEALQAASLDPVLGLHSSLCMFTSQFRVSWEKERNVMQIDPEAADFERRLAAALEKDVGADEAAEFRGILREARDAGMPVGKRIVTVDDFFPEKHWRVLALAGHMVDDPYSGAHGVERITENVYRVTTRAATERGMLEARLTLRLRDPMDEMKLVFSPLLDRFYAGTDWRSRPVRISDSGRIRNELQTLAYGSLETLPDGRIHVDFDRIGDDVMEPDKKALIRKVLCWYKENHPLWFSWLELA